MILRRLTKHVKDQNWFAVGLDFMIVVVGVFVGLQVQQWANEQNRKKSEEAYLIRLHSDVEELTELRSFYDYSRPRITSLVLNANEILKSADSATNLTPSQCNSLVWSSSYNMTIPSDELPTLTELLSAGQIGTISSEAVRSSLLIYIQEADRARDLMAATKSSAVQVDTNFPELFTINVVLTDGGTYRSEASCDLSAMRLNHAFKNAVSLAAGAYGNYTELGVLKVSEKLKVLHETLDKELGIEHPIEEPEKTE